MEHIRVEIDHRKEIFKHFTMVYSVGCGWVESIRSCSDFILNYKAGALSPFIFSELYFIKSRLFYYWGLQSQLVSKLKPQL